MKWVLVLITWNGTLTAVPNEFTDRPRCESAGEAWRLEAKDKVSSARYVCFGYPLPR